MSTNSVSQQNRPNANRKAAGSNWNSRIAQNVNKNIPVSQNNNNKSGRSSVDQSHECNHNSQTTSKSSRQRRKRKENNSVGLYVALDCEMVGIGPNGKDDMLARVSLVTRNGSVLLDKFVKPQFPVTDYRTAISGVRPQDMENGEDFAKVQDEVFQLLKGKILVGHALRHDLTVLQIKHPFVNMRDTSIYKPLCRVASSNGRTPSLKKLAKIVLNLDIQSGEHNSIEDARAAMSIYNQLCEDWEQYHQKQHGRRY